VDAIIRALSMPPLSGASLRIAGTGPSEENLRRLGRGLAVEFLGPLNRDALKREYETASALVLASEFEGLPTVALEALAAGCPVVALEGNGLDEILPSRGGVLARSLQDLPRAMDAALRLRAAGTRVSLPEEFTWSSVGPRILEVYRKANPGVFP
jgi:glycosyltransferase involved in cell wall biosynthesis